MQTQTIELRKAFNQAYKEGNRDQLVKIISNAFDTEQIELLEKEERNRMLISAMMAGKSDVVKLILEKHDIFFQPYGNVKDLLIEALRQYHEKDTELLLALRDIHYIQKQFKSHLYIEQTAKAHPQYAWVLAEMVKDNTKDFGQAITELFKASIYHKNQSEGLELFKNYIQRWPEKIKLKRLKDSFVIALIHNHPIANFLVEEKLMKTQDAIEILFNQKNEYLLRRIDIEGLMILDALGVNLSAKNYELLTKKTSLGQVQEMEYLISYVERNEPQNLPFVYGFVEMTEYQSNDNIKKQALEILEKLVLGVSLKKSLAQKSSQPKHKI